MLEVKTVLFVSVIILLNIWTSNGEKHKCQLTRFGIRSQIKCTIRDLDLTRTNYKIELDIPINSVTIVELTGTAPILSASGLCEAFPNLEEFWATESSIGD